MTTPTVATSPPSASPAKAPAGPTRRRFTVAEYYAMADAGILSENDRVELLDGDLIIMPPIGDWHAAKVNLFTNVLPPQLQGRAVVSVQNPTRLNDSNEPEPDVMLLRWRDDFYEDGHPRPADVLLLIEVSDTTVDYDRNEKLPLYAQAGIPELWIVNRPAGRIEAHTDPSGNEYATVRYFGSGETIAPQAFPDIVLEVNRIIRE